MRRIAAIVTVWVSIISTPPATACTFCGGGVSSRQTLREHFQQAKFVAYGQLKNPRFDPNGTMSTTDFHVAQVLKNYEKLGNQAVLTLPKYVPVIGNTAPDFLIFATVVDGKPDPLHGLPATPSVTEYVKSVCKLDEKDATKRLVFYFTYLDSHDPILAGDAFLEFAKASDAEITAARAALNPATLRKLLANVETPVDRLGVYAMMLGLCGTTEDQLAFSKLLETQPLPDRIRDNLGGYLAAITLLDPDAGWATVEAISIDAKRPYAERLSAIGTVRFFHTTRPQETKAQVLKCYRGLLAHSDLADMAIEDLRRWGYWELTSDILSQFSKPTHSGRLIRRSIVYYALSCPGANAARFVNAVQISDPKLVETVRELMLLQDPAKK